MGASGMRSAPVSVLVFALIAALLVPGLDAQTPFGKFVYQTKIVAPDTIIVEVLLSDLIVPIQGFQANPKLIPGVTQVVSGGPVVIDSNFAFTGQNPFISFSFDGNSIPSGAAGLVFTATYFPGSAALGLEVCPLEKFVIASADGIDITSSFEFESCLTLPEVFPLIDITFSVPQLLSASGSLPARYEFDVNLVTEVPFAGFQLNYDLGDGKAVPSGGEAGSVLTANSYFVNIGTVAVISYPFTLTEISAEENPAFSPLSLRFSDPLTAVDQQFCIDTAQTVFSDIAAQKIGLGFSADSCVDFPAATFSLEASGSTIRVRINNAKAISVFGIQISGPAELESASLGALITDAGFQVIGVSPIIINSPSGSVLSPQLESGELLVLEATTNGEYCILPGTIVFDTTVTPLAFSFVDGQSCVTVDADFCPTAGTGDVTFDGILNIFDLVRLSDAIIADGVVFNECELLSGDVTGDDILNILDVTTAVAIIISGP